MKIKLKKHINLEEILKRYNHSLDSLVSYTIGYDNKVYILLKEEITNDLVKSILERGGIANYFTIILEFDWDESKIISCEHRELGTYKVWFYIIQPIENNLLLIHANCRDDKTYNGIVFDEKGNIIKKYCLGHDINDCIVTKNGNIIVSYGDEGIYSFSSMLASNGLNVWNKEGKIIYKNNIEQNDISDCYAINIDEKENLWYYYYTDFKLIKTDMSTEKKYNPNTEYSNGFLITSDEKNVVFETTDYIYDNLEKSIKEKKEQLIIGKIKEETIEDYEKIDLVYNEENIDIKSFKFLKSQAIFVDNNDRMFIYKF